MTQEVSRIGQTTFWLDEGAYTVEQIENLLSDMKYVEQRHRERLEKSVQWKEEIAAQVLNNAFNPKENK